VRNETTGAFFREAWAFGAAVELLLAAGRSTPRARMAGK